MGEFYKERFITNRKTKIMPRGDGPFQVLEKLNDNANKIDLLSAHQVQNNFNVCDLSPFDILDDDNLNLRTNSFEEGENDASQVVSRSFTRYEARDLQTLQGLFMKVEFLEYILMLKKGSTS